MEYGTAGTEEDQDEAGGDLSNLKQFNFAKARIPSGDILRLPA